MDLEEAIKKYRHIQAHAAPNSALESACEQLLIHLGQARTAEEARVYLSEEIKHISEDSSQEMYFKILKQAVDDISSPGHSR